MAIITHEQKDPLLHTTNISQTPTRNNKVLVYIERLQAIHLSTDANICVWVYVDLYGVDIG